MWCLAHYYLRSQQLGRSMSFRHQFVCNRARNCVYSNKSDELFLTFLVTAAATTCSRGTRGLLSVINEQSPPTTCEKRVLDRTCEKHLPRIQSYPKLARNCAKMCQRKFHLKMFEKISCSSIIECRLLLVDIY